MLYAPQAETACLKTLWTQVGYHPRLPEILFSQTYWRSGVDVFLHLSTAEHFHGGTSNLSNWRVMDLGCGVGRQTLYLAEVAKFVLGTDISPSLIRLAHRYKNLRKLGSRVHFRSLPRTTLKGVPNDSFDFVYSYNMLKFLRFEQHILDYLRDIYRVLRKGGYAQLYVPTREINIDSVDPRVGANLQPASWESLLDALQPSKADVIPKTLPEVRCEWFLIQK